jgi:hypothetical protein
VRVRRGHNVLGSWVRTIACHLAVVTVEASDSIA